MESKEKFIFRIAEEILDNHGDIVDGIHIIETSDGIDDSVKFRIYHSDGHCFDLKRENTNSDDEMDFCNVDDDGYYYSFGEYYDDFKIIGIDSAIELLNHYAGLKRE